MIHNGQNVAAGRAVKVLGGSYWEADGSPVPGTGDAAQRLREQDQDGIDAEVLYPPVFITRFIENISDKEAYLAMVRAYNTFLAEDYCSVAPGSPHRECGDPDDRSRRRLGGARAGGALGLRSICLAQFPHGGGSPAAEDDAFWEAAIESGLAITAHGGFGDRMNPLLVASATGTFDMTMAMASRTFPGPVLRHCEHGGEWRVRPDPRVDDLSCGDQRRVDAPRLLHDGRLVPALQGLVRRGLQDVAERICPPALSVRDRARPALRADAAASCRSRR